MLDLLLLIFVLLAFCSAWLAARWMLGPLDRAAKNREYPIQFSLADFLCLFVQVQLVLAGPATLLRATEEKMKVAGVCVVIVALVCLVWWTGVRTLSRAGIHGTIARSAALVVVIPFGYAVSIAIPVVAIMFAAVANPDPEPELPSAGLLLLLELALFLLAMALTFLTHKILATAERQRPLAPPEGPKPPI
jgi:hypothetical protein